MLTARREPSFHPTAQDAAPAAHAAHATHGPGFTRFMTVVQVVGSVLGIPLGLASGYSIYHANFSPEAHCQGLRTSIVSMLDKSADASTLRMLVRRDVADFEKSCGLVDPDAVAAFKTLLATGLRAARAPEGAKMEVARVPVRREHEVAKHELVKRELVKHVVEKRDVVKHEPVKHEAAKKEAERKEAEKHEVVERAPEKAAGPAAEASRELRGTESTDAQWVASVREALVHGPAERAAAGEAPAAEKAAVPAGPAAAGGHAQPMTPAPVALLAPSASSAAAPHRAAPALPPAASVAAAPAPARTPAPDHPVPPGFIPDAAATGSVGR